MIKILRLSALPAVLTLAATTALAQNEPPLEQGKGIAWASLGFQGDLGGS